MPAPAMTNRGFRRALGILAFGALAGCGSESGQAPPATARVLDPRPDLILVSIDTLRADRLGTYGHDRDTSPNLDALARAGIQFEHAYSTAPWTLVSHLSMLTGLYVDQHGVREGDQALHEDIRPLAQRLSEAGYDTAGFYYEGWIHPRHGFARGFDLFVPHKNVVEAEVHLHEFLDERESDAPLFVFLHLFDVHTARFLPDQPLLYDSPDAFARRYRQDAPDLFVAGDPKRLWNLEQQATEEQYDAIRALYDGALRFTDERLGALLTDWSERGLLDRALLAVTSDHGEGLGLRDGLLPGHGGSFQEGLRVPLILRLPAGSPEGSRGGERVEPAVSTIDLAPTFLTAAGVPADDLPGYDLLAGLRPVDSIIRARHKGQLTLIRWPNKIVAVADDYAPVENLSGWSVRLDEDPAGLKLSRVSTDRKRFLGLRRELNALVEAELAGPGPIRFDPSAAPPMGSAAADQLRALGYTDEVD